MKLMYVFVNFVIYKPYLPVLICAKSLDYGPMRRKYIGGELIKFDHDVQFFYK